MINLSDFEKHETEDGVSLHCNAEIDGQNHTVNFDIEGSTENCARVTIDATAFVVGLLLPAMERGEDLHADAPLDAVMLHKLNHYVVPFLRHYNPDLTPIVITAAETTERPKQTAGKGTLTGMSCGVDSLETFSQYSRDNTPEAFRVNSLAVFDVGAFEDSTPEHTADNKAFTIKKSRGVAKASGCAFYVVTSNIVDFYRSQFTRSVSLRNAACAYALADNCDRYLGASSAEYNGISVLPKHGRSIDNLDSILYPILSGPRLEIFSSGAGTGRTEKTLHIIDHSPFVDQIEICTRPARKKKSHKNCGTCFKCSHFLMLAEAQGVLGRFGGAFELDEYKRRKWVMYQRLITLTESKHANAQSTRDILEASDFENPFGAKAVGTFLGWMTYLRRG